MSTQCPTQPAARTNRSSRTWSPAIAATATLAPARSTTIDLAAGDLYPLAPHANMLIESTAGEVWITQAGNPDDVVLEAGMCHRPAAHGKVVLQALTPARVRIL